MLRGLILRSHGIKVATNEKNDFDQISGDHKAEAAYRDARADLRRREHVQAATPVRAFGEDRSELAAEFGREINTVVLRLYYD
jgi:hypothetical protein